MASGGEEDASKCPKCFEIYKEPKALVCLHTFCEMCIHEYVIKSKEKGLLCNGIECPLCRFVTPVDENTPPEAWAKALRPNFALASLLESGTINTASVKKDENNCQRCSLQNMSNPALVFCSSCNERMCEKCKNVHDSFQFMKNHESVDIGSQEQIQGIATELQTYQKCDQHEKKIKFYCKDDDTLCCSTCAIVGHRACNGLVDVSVIAHDRRSQLQRCLLRKKIVELENKMKMVSSNLVSENKKLTTQATNILTEWKYVREKVNQKLDEFEYTLKEEIKTIQTTESSDSIVKAVQCNDIAGEMRRFQRILELSEEKCTTDQQYVVMKKVFDEFKRRHSETGQRFTEIKSLSLLLELSQPINDLLSISSKGVSVAYKSEAKVIPKCAAKTLSVLAETNIEQVSGDEEIPLYTGLGFLNDGRIVAVDHANRKFILMDEKLNRIGETCLPVNPFSLAVTHDDCVVITTGSEKQLCFYQVNENGTLSENKIIPVNYNCDSISLVNDNTFLVSTFGTDVEPAHLLTFDGEFIGLNCDFDGMTFEDFNEFQCSYDGENLQLLITEDEINTVHVYNLEHIENLQIEDDNIVKPIGIAHYMDDLFFVCSWGTNSIVQLSSQGEVLKSDLLDNMLGPYAICISPKKDKMVVSDNIIGKKKLLLFNIQ